MNRTYVPGVRPMEFGAKPREFEEGYVKPYFVATAPPTPGPVVPNGNIKGTPPAPFIAGVSNPRQLFGA